ncbi:MAG: phosphoribosyltransferase domain-containing protein [Culicoidibacterales bacterium]
MKITITHNPYELDLDQLMVLAKRLNNSKRNFLFVSKILGKHVPIDPNLTQVSGFLLASILYGPTKQTATWCEYLQTSTTKQQPLIESLQQRYQTDESVVVMGFAETATGIGMAVANAIENSYYIHTTREPLTDQESLLAFEEEHSHATTHRCYLSEKSRLTMADHIVLVDDELTTGQSLLNMLKVLMQQTQARKFTMLTILDWRNPEQQAQLATFAQQTRREIEVRALVAGSVETTDQQIYDNQAEIPKLQQQVSGEDQIDLAILPRKTARTKQQPWSYYAQSGRFGVSQQGIANLADYSYQAAVQIMSELARFPTEPQKILVVGHGEDIFIPSQIAAMLQNEFGKLIAFKTTTRSPIFCSDTPDYPIQEIHRFQDQEDNCYYFYNKQAIEAEYDLVIFIVERELSVQLVTNQLTVRL